jgi:hypothetical protein
MEKNVDKLTKQIVKDLRVKLMNVFEVAPHTPTLVEEDLKALDDNYEITVGNATYNDDEVTFKLNIKIKGAKSQSQKDLELYGVQFDNLDITKIARMNGKPYSLVGYRRRARKNPYLIQELDNGKQYTIATDTAKKYFAKEVA